MASRRGENGAPTLARILAEAEEWRMEEHHQSQEAWVGVRGRDGEYEAEIRITAHDALKGGRDRDYRGFVWFYADLFKRNNVMVRVFDIRGRAGGGYILTANRFRHGEEADAMMVDLIAFRHHMRWLILRTDNLAIDVESWESDFRDHLVDLAVVGW